MNKKLFGCLTIIIGGLFLSLELIFLQIIKIIDDNRFPWYSYIFQTPIFIAFIMTIIIIIYGIRTIISTDKEKDNK